MQCIGKIVLDLEYASRFILGVQNANKQPVCLKEEEVGIVARD